MMFFLMVMNFLQVNYFYLTYRVLDVVVDVVDVDVGVVGLVMGKIFSDLGEIILSKISAFCLLCLDEKLTKKTRMSIEFLERWATNVIC